MFLTLQNLHKPRPSLQPGSAPEMTSAHKRGGTADQKAARSMLLLKLHGLSFPEVIRHGEQSIARLLSAAFASDDVVHSELLAMHQQACRSIRDIACTLHRHGVIPVVSTHINVFFLWHAWRQAMSSAEVLEETDQRKLAMKAFTDMYRGKLVVLVPTVCFLVSIRRDTCSFVVVVELHVGPSDSVMRSGIKIRYLAHAHISWFWRLTRKSAYEKHVYVILENKRRRRNPTTRLSSCILEC